ncbi:Cholesterol side-chain cleavage enzyme, mitochondrial [Fulvia fulva]|nr:Cholesterol side-chain cleavage enzyme, mitochondrial [Fulvia fulva]WPV16090.1 Cholesterol side-chain cleavage enzyme, mitochondrial [Fulvia fulva]
MKIIYNRKSLKTPFYASMGSWKGVTSTLGFVDYASAAPTRNNLIQCFQNKNLATLVENISSHISEFCELLRRTTKGNGDVDGVVIFRLLALDIVTDVLWGEQKTLLSSLSDTTPEFLRRFHAFSSYNAMKSFFPGFDTYVRYFGTPKWRQLRQDCSDMDVTAKDALSRWHSEGGHRDKDVLGMLLSMHEAVDERKRVPKDHIPAYMVEMMAAGSSTTSHTATFTCHQLAYHPEIQHKLRKELKTAFPDSANIDEKEMMDLPMLDAVLRETMRSMPMIPGPLERLLGEAVTVDRLQIPSGVIASTAAYDQCRLPSVFPDPESWHPERWFEASDAMHLNWIPFGYGSRSCPGSNLAMTELKYMIGTTFRLFQVGPPENHAQEPLELRDVFVSAQKSGQCWLRFKEDA